MCGIFGVLSKSPVDERVVHHLARHSRQRGKDSCGILACRQGHYQVKRLNTDINSLMGSFVLSEVEFVMGHSRLVTNGQFDNQPVVRDGMAVIHNGIVLNADSIWPEISPLRHFEIDSEVILGIAIDHLARGCELTELSSEIFRRCVGTISAAILFADRGKLMLFSNNGSLYLGRKGEQWCFSSERWPLDMLECQEVTQIKNDYVILEVPLRKEIKIEDMGLRAENIIPKLSNSSDESKYLIHPSYHLLRCKKCILPETMPFIEFDDNGVCNYCRSYVPRNKPKQKEILNEHIRGFRRKSGPDCIVPFSGGRDSSWALHLIVEELKLKPIAYTYDWGMITDLGRRNISLMCSKLGVENIIFADNIQRKRKHIRANLLAWLKSPHLGMISILTAGDKHFFRHIETVKKQTGISLNLWGINPLEVTHFKAGFLGLPPDFHGQKVYRDKKLDQIRYQILRFKAMLGSLGYFNGSLWDTLSGEYYRTFKRKSDYFHVFDYWQWDESSCDSVLSQYNWEKAEDTNTTWRIGDGTAAFYNYLFYLFAGFTEHDTFRSNQIREGQLDRSVALEKVYDENRPRYPNIRWYLDTLELDFRETITKVNSIVLGLRVPTLISKV